MSKFVQVTISKSEGIGYIVYFILEDEEMSGFDFDTYDKALKKFHELAEMVG